MLKGEQLHRAAFDEEGCTIRSGGDEVCLSYDQVAAFYEDQRYFFLMLNRHRGYALEKQGFPLRPAGRLPGLSGAQGGLQGPAGLKMTSGWRELALPAASR